MKKYLFSSPIGLLSVLFLAISMISCSGDDGADGTNGTDGAAGPAGPTGPTGPAGPTGTGNIIYSEWLDVAFKADTMHTSGGTIDTIGYYATIKVPNLTKELLSTADVKAYINANNANDPVIYSLPYRGDNGAYIDIVAQTQEIQLYSNINVATVVATGLGKVQQYRYMIIPGNIKATSRSTVNWSDYASAKNYLGLKD